MDIVIASASSRFAKKWKHEYTTWHEFIERLRTPTRTPESYAEYKKKPKAERDSIKDIGGFVGGTLKGGIRKLENVGDRCLMCLDIDYADAGFLDQLKEKAKFSWVLYSTHSHEPENPRYRLIVPLGEPITAEEYVPLSRLIAYKIGIDYVDDSTYQPHRLMYFPSCSRDGEYIFLESESEIVIDASLLNEYKDWKDASLWHVSSRASAIHTSEIKKAGDPTEKKGLIGSFCRTYTIQEVIEKYLSEEYTGEGDRYTYLGGSTVGGVVIYEDKFAYSHHGTDPAGGKLSNAFDLVRLHKFGQLDKTDMEDEGVTKKPSYKEMIKLASQDMRVKKTIVADKLAEAQNDFAVEINKSTETDWIKTLEFTKQGEIANTINNHRLIMQNDPDLKRLVGLDEFSNKVVLLRGAPWGSEKGAEWSDNDDSSLRHHIEINYNLYGVNKSNDAFRTVLGDNTFHPVKNYLKALYWDGIERLDTLFIDYLGAEDTEYTRAVTRKTMCAGVARILNAGVKFDNMVVLVGNQGIGKSYILSKLGGSWFNDSLNTLQGKDAYEQIQGSWIVELGELKAFHGASREAIKHFLSKTHDTFRAPYERRTRTHARQCVFFGTTNTNDFLSDPTGERRTWVIPLSVQEATKDLFKELDDYEVEQLWAEAREVYKQGEPLYLNKEMTEQAQEVQTQHYEEDSTEGLIFEFLEKKIPEDFGEYDIPQRREFWFNGTTLSDAELVERDSVSAIEIWCEMHGGTPKDFDRKKSADIKKLLRRNFKNESSKRTKTYGKQRVFLLK